MEAQKSVIVQNPRTGEAQKIRAGEEIPRWAEELISNPRVTGETDDFEDFGDDGSSGDSDGLEPPYSKYKKAELVEEAERRGLDSEGTVEDLVERLEADDEA